MKQVLRIMLASLLSLVILISGTGFTFGKISCDDCGIAFDYKEIEDCCDEESGHEASFACGCCDIINIDLSTDEFYAGKYLVDTQPVVSNLPFSFLDTYDLRKTEFNRELPLPDEPCLPSGGREFLDRTPHLLI